MTSKSRLGKGLGALFPALPGENPVEATATPTEQPVTQQPAPMTSTTAKVRNKTADSTANNSAKESVSAKSARSKRASMPALDEITHPSDLFFGGADVATASDTASDDGKPTASTSSIGSKTSKRSTKTTADSAAKTTEKDVSRETLKQDTADNAAEPELNPVEGGYLAELSLNEIGPNAHQPRTVFDEDDLNELAASITEVGVLQPIVVRRRPAEQIAAAQQSGAQAESGNHSVGAMDSPYELIMGERRWRASQLAGLETIPAIVKTTSDDDMLRDALLENLHRVALNPLEEAAAYQQMIEEFGLTQAQLSKSVSKSRPQIANTLRLLNLPALVQKKVAAGVLSAGHARALLGLTDVDEMDKLATRIIAEGLSVRSTEEIVAMKVAAGEQPKKVKTSKTNPWVGSAIQQSLENHFDTKVAIKGTAKHGRIEIVFSSPEDMDRILSLLVPGSEATVSTESQWV
ncbi:ParB/RepB/Spo0J family partition protein [Bifidobacterium eulemuris]|uniref:ParB-like partition protein n=1 Tax=Bifidobacterium eulemuris TaxID=1765219 RepID=A0A261G1X1_9BIFI|nr:ParB/RepB/Spo0J family partition protein [Bifidobacterium eulemuris]OZG65235.1 ParB-like partition protein [Bifidobacterium eulemuris]QOL32344.1 ParB/RepB/Spo0J family partition protein [Bifidobacterium eulemuris]